MFWKKQNHIDREILSEMMFTDYRPLAVEIFMTAHWEELPNAAEKDSSAVYGCYHNGSIILAKKNDDDIWDVKVCDWNNI